MVILLAFHRCYIIDLTDNAWCLQVVASMKAEVVCEAVLRTPCRLVEVIGDSIQSIMEVGGGAVLGDYDDRITEVNSFDMVHRGSTTQK